MIDNLGSGGAQRQAVEVAVRLSRQPDVEVAFAVYRDVDFFRARLDEAEIPVVCLQKRGTVDPFFPLRLRRFIRSHRPDILHAFLPMPVIWSALARGRSTDSTVWVAGERSAPEHGGGRIFESVLRRAYLRFDTVFANSCRASQVLVDAWGLRRERVHYLPNGIDLEEWDRRSEGPCPVDLEPGCTHLALIGRLSEEKGHLLILEAVSRLAEGQRRRLRLWFFGADGPMSSAVDEEIERRGLRDVAFRRPPTPHLPALMRRLDGLVLASRFEGSPNVVLEAMASGLPVLSYDVGDVPSLVRPADTGWLLPPGDIEALTRGLVELLEAPPGVRQRMGAAGRAVVAEEFAIDVVAQKHLDLYRRLADELRSHAEARPLG